MSAEDSVDWVQEFIQCTLPSNTRSAPSRRLDLMAELFTNSHFFFFLHEVHNSSELTVRGLNSTIDNVRVDAIALVFRLWGG